MRLHGRRRRGQQLVEFSLTAAVIVIPVTMMIVFTAQLLWVWHSVVDFTNQGAKYAATHCYSNGGSNVLAYMRANVPMMVDRDQFRDGTADIEVTYFQRDPDTGTLAEFTCTGSDCSRECIPDMVRVRIPSYQFRGLQAYLGLPPVNLPNFQASIPVESLGCSATDGDVTCAQ